MHIEFAQRQVVFGEAARTVFQLLGLVAHRDTVVQPIGLVVPAQDYRWVFVVAYEYCSTEQIKETILADGIQRGYASKQ